MKTKLLDYQNIFQRELKQCSININHEAKPLIVKTSLTNCKKSLSCEIRPVQCLPHLSSWISGHRSMDARKRKRGLNPERYGAWAHTACDIVEGRTDHGFKSYAFRKHQLVSFYVLKHIL